MKQSYSAWVTEIIHSTNKKLENIKENQPKLIGLQFLMLFLKCNQRRTLESNNKNYRKTISRIRRYVTGPASETSETVFIKIVIWPQEILSDDC